MTDRQQADSARISVAITGSRDGLKGRQSARLVELLCEHQLSEFHYGDCVGVDSEALWTWVECGSGVAHAHPATMNPQWDAAYRARTTDHHEMLGIIVHDAKGPLDRNRDMVDAADVVWAFPASAKRKGGTWYTIDYAEKVGVPVVVVLP